MKRILNINITAALALASALALPLSSRADGYGALSLLIARSAAEHSVKKIAVLDFSAKGGAEKSETAYVAEKIGVQLAGSRGVSLIERTLLEKVLKEAGLSLGAGGAYDNAETLRGMLSVDAVVTGVVFADGEALRVFARLIDTKTGRVLIAAEALADRLPPAMSGGLSGDMEPPEVPFPELPSGWGSPSAVTSASFRDAVSGSGSGSCAGRRSAAARLNTELVDAKARFWAARMKAPGFSLRALTRNPGSEIGDPGVKARFYKLLTAYYRDHSGPGLEPEKNFEVENLIKLEERVSDECGVR
ncbi:MAG TPA: hypothetical protein DCZ92_10935 [Elusimicrobia bacterium]|nr:hypothetical protein [Elusimicrobiota bacterium]